MDDNRILLLEDDANLGFVIREHLEAHGFGVTLRTNGVEGLEETKKSSFDLLLVDVMMPKKDGFTFTKEFRAKDAATPIIFLTAKALKEDRVEGFRIGGDDYVTKPFSIDELLLRIKAVLRRTKGATPKDAGDEIFRLGKLTFDARRQLSHRFEEGPEPHQQGGAAPAAVRLPPQPGGRALRDPHVGLGGRQHLQRPQPRRLRLETPEIPRRRSGRRDQERAREGVPARGALTGPAPSGRACPPATHRGSSSPSLWKSWTRVL